MLNSKRFTIVGKHEEFEDSRFCDQTLVIPTKNLLLAALPHPETYAIIADATPVRFKPGDEIYAGGDPIKHLYFPIDCVISAMGLLGDGSTVEITMTGREGLVGLAAIIGGRRSLHWTRASAGGVALRISNERMHELFVQNEAIQNAVLRAYRSMFTQVCQRSVCNSRHSLLQRLSVWLLMMNDRLGHEALPFTQEDIASHISVRRAGISVAASMLQDAKAISYHRGTIVIANRDPIEETACECYDVLRLDNRGGGRTPKHNKVKARHEAGALLPVSNGLPQK